MLRTIKTSCNFGIVLIGFFLALFIALPIAAQTKPKPTLNEALIQVRTPLELAEGKFSGQGADVLTQAVAQSRFVLIGEDHMSREIPQFAAALCDVMRPDYYAVEVGPQAAQFVSGILHSADRIARMAARMNAYPNNMAFLDSREENDAAAHCATSSRNPHFQLWGLDQEFLGAAGTLLDAMAETKPGPQSRSAIASAQASDKIRDQQARESGDPNKTFLLASSDADLQSLEKAVKADGNAATQTLLREFLDSRKIYQLNADGSPDSNRIRAELFKQQFLADYSSVQRQRQQILGPRVLFKFGDNHVAKGFSVLHQRDLGNFIAELADREKTQSLHVLILGARGTHATFGGYAKPLGHEPFVMTDDPDYKWLSLVVTDLLPQRDESGNTTLTLFDLRKLRFRGIDLPPEWERVVYGYDLFVFIPQLTPALAIQ